MYNGYVGDVLQNYWTDFNEFMIKMCGLVSNRSLNRSYLDFFFLIAKRPIFWPHQIFTDVCHLYPNTLFDVKHIYVLIYSNSILCMFILIFTLYSIVAKTPDAKVLQKVTSLNKTNRGNILIEYVNRIRTAERRALAPQYQRAMNVCDNS